jgi:hypothetical protein
MFVRYFVDLPMPFERAEHAMLEPPDGWLPDVLREADREGDRLLAEVGFGSAVRLHTTVELTMRRPIRTRDRLVVPFEWRAGTRLLPAVDADVEIAPMGPSRTQVAVSARYTPPLGSLGEAVDRALLHRVAEATIRDLVQRIAASLERRASAAVS